MTNFPSQGEATRARLFGLALLVASGCSGIVGSTGDPLGGGGDGVANKGSASGQATGAGASGGGLSDASPANDKPSPTMLRRLTNREYRQYADLAASLVKSYALPACPSGAKESECAKSFITGFGMSAFRQPLSSAEVQRYEALYADERARSTHAQGLGQVFEAFLQSPKFLYRSELGLAADGANRTLTPYEVASELSYLFTSLMADDDLFAAAHADALRTPAQLETQARRATEAFRSPRRA